jgi:hypothetical protein
MGRGTYATIPTMRMSAGLWPREKQESVEELFDRTTA